ncbi:MAG: DNA replication/repair protein RecF [Thiolinea sp.]
MWLKQLSIENCRLIAQASVELSPKANVFIGDNASGKSSFLEALSILSRGRSFRSPRIREIIRYGEERLTVAGKIKDDETGAEYPLGISKTNDETRIRINHADINQQAELSSHLPLTIIHPDTLEILSGGPSQRRALLDWVAFYRSPDFHQDWRNYQRILKQRNVCLRDEQQRFALQHWTEQLVSLQPRIHQFRQEALKAVITALDKLAPLFTHTGIPKLKLYSGFPGSVAMNDLNSIQAFLDSRKEQEIQQGISLYGCHRGDLNVILEGMPVAKFASRGQLKMLGVALLLAQSQAITTDVQKRGIIAIDDLISELDTANQTLLYQVLRQTDQQLIVTGTQLPGNDQLIDVGQMFHVEHGQFTELNNA